jgi:hypothetical protein
VTADTVEQWAPCFTKQLTDEQVLNPDYALSRWGQQIWCKLCDAPVEEDAKVHMREHRSELKAWRVRHRRDVAKAAADRLREQRREKKRQKELGIA